MDKFGPVVDHRWLAGNQNDVQLFDSRWHVGGGDPRSDFESGHIPGAVFVDLDRDLSAPAAQPGGRHPFPAASAFAATMGRLGYDGSSPAVIYDTNNGGIAARLWFMLRLIGCPAAILDGGLDAWTGELATGPAEITPVAFVERPWPADRLIDADEVEQRIASGGFVADARSAERYHGAENPIDDRYGHIPGAASMPWTGNVDSGTGRFLSIDDLAERWDAAVRHDSDERPALYCGSGVTACNNMAALEMLGIEADLYVGSWSEWGADSDRPLET